MFQVKQLVPVVVLAALSGGCYQGIDGLDLTDEISEMRELHNNNVQLNGLKFNDLVLNGLKFNGLKFNDVNFNGLKFNGLKFNDVQFNGLKFNDVNFNGLKFNGSNLTATTLIKGKMVEFRGEDLVGGELTFTAFGLDAKDQPSSADFVIRINDVYTDEDYDDIYYYDLSLAVAGSESWEPLCVDAANNPLPVIPLRNYWDEKTGDRIDDPDVVTFACTSGVLAHCVQWGYRPWEESMQCEEGKGKKGKKKKKDCETVSLTDYHQACTRMARADYCGDGTPWTVPGTPIDIFDHLSPQIETQETKWPVEAEWTPDGAYCLDDIRQQAWKADGLYPKCPKPLAKKKGDCGSLDDHRALLVSRFEPVKKKEEKNHGKK